MRLPGSRAIAERVEGFSDGSPRSGMAAGIRFDAVGGAGVARAGEAAPRGAMKVSGGARSARGITACAACGSDRTPVSSAIGYCGSCLRSGRASADRSAAARRASRSSFALPPFPPRGGGAACRVCANLCEPAAGGLGFCGVRARKGRSVVPRAGRGAYVRWYHDPLPTNCVADWVCPGGTGYGRDADAAGPERGWNLAVFYLGCSFDCLFCQNWSCRAIEGPARTAEELADAVGGRTRCICYFGGDPGPQIEHALRASRLAEERARGRVLRICWETNGCVAPRLLRAMAERSLRSGGLVKFDIKAWSDPIHRALCGVGNGPTRENFRRLVGIARARSEPPLAVASTLLVPGYVDAVEVRAIARWIASLEPATPYRLLAFHPDFLLRDLPPTSRAHTEACARAAREAGLCRVSIGNVHLLSGDAYDGGA